MTVSRVPMPPMPVAYSYIRMSSAAQMQGDSARRQIERARAFAERNGYELAPPMKDLGISAFKGRNRQKGALGAFLTALWAGEIAPGVLIIEAIDRLSREAPFDILMLLREILLTGCRIHMLSMGQTMSMEDVNGNPGLLSTIATMAALAHRRPA